MLIVRMRINADLIGVLTAQRVEAVVPKADDVYTYRCSLVTMDDSGPPREVWAGRLRHRYGDGGWALAVRVVRAAGLEPSDMGG